MAINKDIEARFLALESAINKKTYNYCLCFDPERFSLRLDKQTGEIEVFNEEIPFESGPFILFLPEMVVYSLYEGVDTLESINPFERWYVEQLCKSKDEAVIMKKIRKYMKDREKEDIARRAQYKQFEGPYQGPIKSNDVKPIINEVEQKPIINKENTVIPINPISGQRETNEQMYKRILENRIAIDKEFGSDDGFYF